MLRANGGPSCRTSRHWIELAAEVGHAATHTQLRLRFLSAPTDSRLTIASSKEDQCLERNWYSWLILLVLNAFVLLTCFLVHSILGSCIEQSWHSAVCLRAKIVPFFQGRLFLHSSAPRPNPQVHKGGSEGHATKRYVNKQFVYFWSRYIFE